MNDAKKVQGTEELVKGRKTKKEDEEHERRVVEIVAVPSDKIRLVASKTFRDRLENAYGVAMTILAERGGNNIKLKGAAKNVDAARRDILENLPCELIHPLEGRFIKSIEGYNGWTIRTLREDHKVTTDETLFFE